jgi:hypothetical protein
MLPFYELLGLPDGQTQTERLQQRAIQFLVKKNNLRRRWPLCRNWRRAKPKLEAVCCEGCSPSW